MVCIVPQTHPDLLCQLSDLHAVNCSVPQESVLGPLEFVVYIEDLDDVTHRNQLNRHMYADDTQLIRSTCISRIQLAIERLQAGADLDISS